MDDKTIYQLEVRETIEKFLNNKVMIPVYGKKIRNQFDMFYQCRLIPIDMENKELSNDNVNDWGSLMPGFTQCGGGSDADIIYSRFNNCENIEPFIIQKNYNELKPDEIEIVEEFRLLNNLYYDKTNNYYMDLIDNNVVVEIKDGLVLVNKKYLKRYLAVKNMSMAIQIDSRVTLGSANQPIKRDNLEINGDKFRYSLSINHDFEKSHSVLYAKIIVSGCQLKDCGYWPYEAEPKYEDFIIGSDEDGNEVMFTSNPKELSSYFGVNPETPHYLTLVYFDRNVLSKYYSSPDKYSIEDGIIRCGTLWSMYVDNLSDSYVSAYLGDLGRDLPNQKEQLYWKSHNIIIDGKLSSAKFQRDFMAQHTDSDSADFSFKSKYIRLNNIFKEEMGWPLFLELDEDDKYCFDGLRIPLTNSSPETDMLILSSVKILIDSINEKRVVAELNGQYDKLVGSISKLESWFKKRNLLGFEEHIQFLRNLQELRSSGTGHRKGKGYKKITSKMGIDKNDYRGTLIDIFVRARNLLVYVEENIDKLK